MTRHIGVLLVRANQLLDHDNRAKQALFMNWQRRSRYRERASLHEEPYFEHPVRPKKRTAFRASSKRREGLGKANVMIGTRVLRVSRTTSAGCSGLSDV
jgi:hypothetical protein